MSISTSNRGTNAAPPASAGLSEGLPQYVQDFVRKPGRLLIDGEQVEAASGESFETLDPANEESLGRVVLPDPRAGRADALPPPFVCSWTDGGHDAAWLQVAGELDIATVPQLEHMLLEPQSQSRLVVIDLRELAFMDSFGARAIAKASVRARQTGRRLVILRRRPSVDRMFALAGFSDQVEIGVINSVEPAVGRA